jgi:hypothetical protein
VLHLPSPAGMFIYSSCGKCPFPRVQWAFLTDPLLQDFPLQDPLLLPSTADLFIYNSMSDCPSPPSALRASHPLCYVSVFVVAIYYSVWFFSLFSLGRGQSVQGATLIWPRAVCGSTACHLAHLVVCFSPAGR